MALATFSRGTKAKLDATKKTDGRIYVTTDTGNMYVDVGNETDSSAQRFLIGADGIKAASDAVASAKSYTDTVAAGKANTAHTHEMADVTGLSDALAGTASKVSALGTRMDDAESSIAELAKRLPIYYYTNVPSESSITEKPQLAVIKGGAVYLVE